MLRVPGGGAVGVVFGACRFRDVEPEAFGALLALPLRELVGGVAMPACARNWLPTRGRCVAGFEAFEAESHLSGWGSIRGLDMAIGWSNGWKVEVWGDWEGLGMRRYARRLIDTAMLLVLAFVTVKVKSRTESVDDCGGERYCDGGENTG